MQPHVLHPGLFGLKAQDIPCADASTELHLSGVTVHNGHYDYLLTTPEGIKRTDQDPTMIEHLPVMDREFDSVTLNRGGVWLRLCLHQPSAVKKNVPIGQASSVINTPLFVLKAEFQSQEKRWTYRIEKCRRYCLAMAGYGISTGDSITAIDDKLVSPDALPDLVRRLTQTGQTVHTVSVLHHGVTRRISLPAEMMTSGQGER